MWLYSSVPPAFWSVREDSKYAAHLKKKGWVFCGISHFTCTVGHRLLPMFVNYESWWLAWRHELIIYCVGSSLNTAAKGCKKCCLYYFIYGRKVQAYCLNSLWRLGVLCVCVTCLQCLLSLQPWFWAPLAPMCPVQVPKFQFIIVDRPQVACQEALLF